jgi:predicted PilT family ATPase
MEGEVQEVTDGRTFTEETKSPAPISQNGEGDEESDLANNKRKLDSSTGMPAAKKRDVAVSILVPAQTVGSIIGKGGATVKELNEQSQAKISVNVGPSTQLSDERMVTITGSLESIERAQLLIMAKVISF